MKTVQTAQTRADSVPQQVHPGEMILGWLEGLAKLGCTFVELVPDEKRTKRPWDKYLHYTGSLGASSATTWLRMGSGVGILPKPPLWILDADSPEEVSRIEEICLDARIVPLVVRTPSGGAHFYFYLPDCFQLSVLKNHLCHPKNADGEKVEADFKFGPRTLVVAPGTYHKGKTYQPSATWREPPTANPAMFLPDGQFWKDQRPFLVNTRPLKDRLARARFYLVHRAHPSVAGRGGHKTLAGVCGHLVAYLDLDPSTAFSLLTFGEYSWNSRCTDLHNKPFPCVFPAALSNVSAVR